MLLIHVLFFISMLSIFIFVVPYLFSSIHSFLTFTVNSKAIILFSLVFAHFILLFIFIFFQIIFSQLFTFLNITHFEHNPNLYYFIQSIILVILQE